MLAITMVVWAFSVILVMLGLALVVSGAAGAHDGNSGMVVLCGLAIATIGVFGTIVCADLHARLKAESAPVAVETPK